MAAEPKALSPLIKNALSYLQAGQADEAELLLSTHVARHPEDADALNLLGVACHALGSAEQAREHLSRAVQAQPDDPVFRLNFGSVLSEQGHLRESAAQLKAACDLRPGFPEALLVLASIHQREGNLQLAAACAEEILSNEPGHPEAWVRLALVRHAQGDEQPALEAARKAVAVAPEHAPARRILGIVAAELGAVAEAAEAFKSALGLAPDMIATRTQYAGLLRDDDQVDAALATLQDGLARAPQSPELLAAYGNALRAADRLEEAAEMLARASSMAPDDAQVWNNLGLVHSLRDHLAEAEACFRKALNLDGENPLIINNLGVLLLRRVMFEEAIDHLRRALALQPGYVEAANNLGAVLYLQGHLEEATSYFEQTLADNPEDTFALFSLAVVKWELQDLQGAAELAERALAVEPDQPMALNILGVVRTEQCRAAEAADLQVRAADAGTQSAPVFYSNYLFTSLYDEVLSNDEILARHKVWAERYAAHIPGQFRIHKRDADPDRRLRLAYVSPDYRAHSVSFFIEPILEHHDRAQYEVWCYANVSRTDGVTERLKGRVDQWIDTAGMTDDQFMRQLREDQIDILVDLGGHTSGNRMAPLSRKPAPIQIQYLGYPETSGVAAFDYRLTDDRADPSPVADQWATEKLIRLPDCFHCYRPMEDAPPVGPLPALNKGYVTFTSFNVQPKVNDDVLATWAEILTAAPSSRLMMKSKQLRDTAVCARIAAFFEGQGVDPQRIDLHGFVPSFADHLALYGQADLGLDPFPYNGTTTTCEALWMGVPVLTMAGDNHRSRVGVSLLHAVGLDEQLVAKDRADYIARAVAFAQDPSPLAALREAIRDRMAVSPLCDAPRFVKHLEQQYRNMWHQWCARSEPTRELKAQPPLLPDDAVSSALSRNR